METEMNYIELLEKLKEDVESDCIPSNEKHVILFLISILEEQLWPYSA